MSGRNRPVSERVVEELSNNTGVDPLDLEPLYEVVDPDALNALFSGNCDGSSTAGSVQFQYEGHTVTVYGDGEIQISEAFRDATTLHE